MDREKTVELGNQVWASPRGIAEKHQKAWLKVVCCNLPDAA